ncbi:MAG: aminotransferase class IV [Pelovirga sp.]
MLVNINGQFIPTEEARVAVNDGAFLYGDSLFETLKACRNHILLRNQHLDRIEQAARLLDFPWRRTCIETALTELAPLLSTPVSRIRLTLSRGPYQGLAYPAPEQGWFMLTAAPYDEIHKHTRDRGVSCCLAPNQRVNPFSHLPQVKYGNYADCLYARNFARRQQADEALFVDDNRNLLEGATSNIFAVINNQLITPPPGNLVLSGIMRQQVIKYSKEVGISCVEHPLPLADASNASEIFICNSLIDLVPVNTIDGKTINRGEYWKEIYKHISAGIAP